MVSSLSSLPGVVQPSAGWCSWTVWPKDLSVWDGTILPRQGETICFVAALCTETTSLCLWTLWIVSACCRNPRRSCVLRSRGSALWSHQSLPASALVASVLPERAAVPATEWLPCTEGQWTWPSEQSTLKVSWTRAGRAAVCESQLGLYKCPSSNRSQILRCAGQLWETENIKQKYYNPPEADYYAGVNPAAQRHLCHLTRGMTSVEVGPLRSPHCTRVLPPLHQKIFKEPKCPMAHRFSRSSTRGPIMWALLGALHRDSFILFSIDLDKSPKLHSLKDLLGKDQVPACCEQV
jgi:hypothetical protein